MSWIDLLIIAVYLAGVVAAGVWFSKRQTSTRQYFLAGRDVPWWAIAASIVATETSTITFISVPGIAYSRGGDFGFLQLAIGYIVGRTIIAAFFVPAYFRGSIITVYELLQGPFGPNVRSLASSLFVVMRTIADGIRLLLTAFVLAAVVAAFMPSADPGATMFWSIVLLGIIMILFTLLGGMEAVLWIEVVQLCIYLAGAIGAALVLISLVPGGLAGGLSIAAEAGKLQIFDFSFDFTRPYVFWAGLAGGAVLTMSTHGTDQFMVQRYLCARSPRQAAMAIVVSGVFVLLQFALFLTIGALLFAFYRPDAVEGYQTGVAAAPFAAADQVFPAFLTQHLPTGLAGLVVAAIFAAALSSSLNSISAAATHDIWRRFVPDASDRRELIVSRLLTAVAGVIQICVALYFATKQRSALDLALGVASLLNGPVLGVFVLAWLRVGTAVPALAGMACGLAAVTAVWRLTALAWPWYTIVGAAATLIVGYTASRIVRTEQAI